VKPCTKCGVEKSLDDFYLNRSKRDGRGSECKECEKARAAAWRKAHPEKHRERIERWRRANPEKARSYATGYSSRWGKAHPDRRRWHAKRAKLRYRYGLTIDEYEALLAEPCGICGDRSEVIDHDHGTAKIRQALCRRCNSLLGFACDDPDRLRDAADYLARHSESDIAEWAAA
jgi:hypothetical protein